MNFQLQQEQFDSLGQWFAWRVGLDLSDFCEAVPPEMADNQAAELRRGEAALHRFFQDLVADLYQQPKAYGVPEFPYETSLPDDQAREDRLRAGRLKVRQAIETGLLDFLYQIGRMGEVEGAALRVSRSFYDRLVAEKKKKVRTAAFPQPLERLGLTTLVEKENVLVSNDRYPGMMMALDAFAKECARIKDLDLYFFRRCDFAVFQQKRELIFEDGLRVAPEALRPSLVMMDALMRERKFKRQILVANADGGYSFRYSKKSDSIVYWCRIRSWSSHDLTHHLRWHFTKVSPALFARLDAAIPGLAERVFHGISTCKHCYGENCMARELVAYNGTVKEVCREAGWGAIGKSPQDFENLRAVVCLLDDIISEKRS